MSILWGPEEKNRQQSSKSNKYGNLSNTKSYEDILVFGYECKFFRDNETANKVNSGGTLIPWMGNKDLMIDRYL